MKIRGTYDRGDGRIIEGKQEVEENKCKNSEGE